MTTVYVIKNNHEIVYIGITDNMNRRIMQHRDGKTYSTNRTNTNWELLHSWEIQTRELALVFERWLHKTFFSRKNRRPAWACRDLWEFILDCPFFDRYLQQQIQGAV